MAEKRISAEQFAKLVADAAARGNPLTSQEEKLLRMRGGYGLPLDARLESHFEVLPSNGEVAQHLAAIADRAREGVERRSQRKPLGGIPYNKRMAD